MIGVSYRVAGHLVGDREPVDTPFVTVDLRIGWWHLLHALLRREALDVQVTVDADPDTMAAVQDVLDVYPPGATLADVSARLRAHEARAAAAREQIDRLLDAATAS